MIDKMKKLTFLVTNSEYEGFINSLRDLGVVHVTQLQQGASSPELTAAQNEQKRYADAMSYLQKKVASASAADMEKASTTPVEAGTPSEIVSLIEQMQVDENRILHAMDDATEAIAALEPWGEFRQQDMQRTMEAAGLTVGFWRTSGKFLRKEWIDEYFAIPVNEFNKRTYFLTFSSEKLDIAAEQIDLPEGTLSEWEQRERELVKENIALQASYLAIFAQQKELLEQGALDARNEVSLQTVRLSDMALAEDSVRMMLGWVKADATDALQKYLDDNHIFYEMTEPEFEDEVPISLTNGRFSRLFEPILKMYSLPNYNDLDPTTFFAPFFMLFFGLCMGDAGYGMLILLAGIYLALKGSDGVRPYGRLACWLGGSTLICGLLTGTLFGISLADQDWAWIQPVKPYFLTESGMGPIGGYPPMMVISVIIGMVQVLLGMFLKGMKLKKNYGIAYAIGTFSWFVALLTAIVLFGVPMCGVELPGAVQAVLYGLIALSAVGIFLYNSPAAYKSPVLGPLKNLAGGVWATYGMSTGLLGDLLSYIRLFALGLTGGVLGGVFNQLGLQMTEGLPMGVNWLVMIIILLLGHGLTFALSAISAFVHPMRLTFVEFFKNSDFSGGGKAYEPFRKE